MDYKDQRIYEIRKTSKGYDVFVWSRNFKIIPTELFYESTIEILKDYFNSNNINKSVEKYMVDFYQMIYDDRRGLPYKMCGITVREFLHRIDIENGKSKDESKNTD